MVAVCRKRGTATPEYLCAREGLLWEQSALSGTTLPLNWSKMWRREVSAHLKRVLGGRQALRGIRHLEAFELAKIEAHAID